MLSLRSPVLFDCLRELAFVAMHLRNPPKLQDFIIHLVQLLLITIGYLFPSLTYTM